MPSDTGPRSLAEKFFRTCVFIFAGVILLALTVELIRQIWWILVLLALIVTTLAVAVSWWRHRNTWQ